MAGMHWNRLESASPFMRQIARCNFCGLESNQDSLAKATYKPI